MKIEEEMDEPRSENLEREEENAYPGRRRWSGGDGGTALSPVSFVVAGGLVEELELGQKWDKLFRRKELMHVAACKEFYANLTVSMSKEKEVARTRVRGVNIELDSMILASILGVPSNNGICEHIKDVWEESKFYKPLEITKKFANDELITV
ncbi:hypothetical protein Dimus_013822, partial [Dionaea muscipula]